MKYPEVFIKSINTSVSHAPIYSMGSLEPVEAHSRLETELTMMYYGSGKDITDFLAMKREPIYILTYAQLKELVGVKIDEILTQE